MPKHLDIGDPDVVEENINFKQVLWLRKPISELVKDDEIKGETLKRYYTDIPITIPTPTTINYILQLLFLQLTLRLIATTSINSLNK